MSALDTFLSHLGKVKEISPGRHAGRWKAICPAHDDHNPSLAVTLTHDGAILVSCQSQHCSFAEIVESVGMKQEEFFPDYKEPDYQELEHKGKGIPRNGASKPRDPFIPAQVFDIARLEIGVAAICASYLHRNRTISESDYERLFLAVERLNDIAEASYGR